MLEYPALQEQCRHRLHSPDVLNHKLVVLQVDSICHTALLNIVIIEIALNLLLILVTLGRCQLKI